MVIINDDSRKFSLETAEFVDLSEVSSLFRVQILLCCAAILCALILEAALTHLEIVVKPIRLAKGWFKEDQCGLWQQLAQIVLHRTPGTAVKTGQCAIKDQNVRPFN